MLKPCLLQVAMVLGLFGCGCSALGPSAPCNDREPPAQTVSLPLRDAQASERNDVVAVLATVQGTDSWCTGVVIEPDLVLTAEHCLGPALPPSAQVDCATATLPAISPQSNAWVLRGGDVKAVATADYLAVANVRVPAATGRLCGDDIALLELANPLSSVSESTVTPDVPEIGSAFTAAGYGADGVNSGILRENQAAHITCVGTQCNDTRIAESELLAHSGACEGDSGSPAIDAEGRSFAMAVRSSTDCSETAYLQLAGYTLWIATNAVDVATAHQRSAPRWALDTIAQSDAGSAKSDSDAAANTNDAGRLYAYGGGCSVSKARRSASFLSALVLGLLLTLSRSKAARRGPIFMSRSHGNVRSRHDR